MNNFEEILESSQRPGIQLFKVVFEEGTREEQVRGNMEYRSIIIRKIKIETVYQVGKYKTLFVEDGDGKKLEINAVISDIRYQPVGDRWCIVIYLMYDEYEAPVIIRADVHSCRMFRDADTIWGFSILEEEDKDE